MTKNKVKSHEKTAVPAGEGFGTQPGSARAEALRKTKKGRSRKMFKSKKPELPMEVANRKLDVFFLVDSSGSMAGGKIASLNQAIREIIPEIKGVLSKRPEVEGMIRVIRFSDTAEWVTGPTPVGIDAFSWVDIKAGGDTYTGRAIRLLSNALKEKNMPQRGFPPVCILISDGCCTEEVRKYNRAIENLNGIPWGEKAVRIAIAVGDSGDYDEVELEKFCGKSNLVKVSDVKNIVKEIKLVTTDAIELATKNANEMIVSREVPRVAGGGEGVF